jgi:hypothetical protein
MVLLHREECSCIVLSNGRFLVKLQRVSMSVARELSGLGSTSLVRF